MWLVGWLVYNRCRYTRMKIIPQKHIPHCAALQLLTECESHALTSICGDIETLSKAFVGELSSPRFRICVLFIPQTIWL